MSDAGQVGPRTVNDLEEIVAETWRLVLGTDDFTYTDRFFDVGGDSLLLTTVRDHLREALPDTSFRLLDLFQHPTIDELARFFALAECGGR